MARRRNDGLRKVCQCPRRQWKDCEHLWHFNFKWKGDVFRFTLEREIRHIVQDAKGKWRRDPHSLGAPITNKIDAEKERDRLRVLIRDGQLRRGVPVRDSLTVGDLLDAYERRKLRLRAGGTTVNDLSQLEVLKRTELMTARGDTRAFGAWLIADVTADALLQYRETRQVKQSVAMKQGSKPVTRGGQVAVNRNLGLLRAAYNWAILAGLLTDSPFKRGSLTTVRLTKETRRTRRLQEGEEERLMAACGPHLRAVVEALLATGCRSGEILSLRWADVAIRAGEIRLRPLNTKTRTGRTVPINSRLRAILEMRRAALREVLKTEDGSVDEDAVAAAYVFGTEIGSRVKSVKTAWRAACRRANIEDLHMHDLRRECGSRWVDTGVPLHQVQAWLCHENISQTSTYLKTAGSRANEAMRLHEERWAALQRPDGLQPHSNAADEGDFPAAENLSQNGTASPPSSRCDTDGKSGHSHSADAHRTGSRDATIRRDLH